MSQTSIGKRPAGRLSGKARFPSVVRMLPGYLGETCELAHPCTFRVEQPPHTSMPAQNVDSFTRRLPSLLNKEFTARLNRTLRVAFVQYLEVEARCLVFAVSNAWTLCVLCVPISV